MTLTNWLTKVTDRARWSRRPVRRSSRQALQLPESLERRVVPVVTNDPIAGDGVIDGSEAPNLVVSGTGATPLSTVTVTVDDLDLLTAAVSITTNADALGNFATAAFDVTSLNDGTVTVTSTDGTTTDIDSAVLNTTADDCNAGGGNLNVRIRNGRLRFRGPLDASANIELLQSSNGLIITGVNGTTINGQTQFNAGNITKLRGRFGNLNDCIHLNGSPGGTALDVSLSGYLGINHFHAIDANFSRPPRLRNFEFVNDA